MYGQTCAAVGQVNDAASCHCRPLFYVVGSQVAGNLDGGGLCVSQVVLNDPFSPDGLARSRKRERAHMRLRFPLPALVNASFVPAKSLLYTLLGWSAGGPLWRTHSFCVSTHA